MTAHRQKRKRSDAECFFDFEFFGGEEINDSKLRELMRRSDIQNPRNFTIHEPYWSESLLRGFIAVFRHFAERGQLWDRLRVIPRTGHLSSTSHYYFLRPLLFASNTMNLFREIDVCAPLLCGGDGGTSGIGSALSGSLLNARLRAVSISSSSSLATPSPAAAADGDSRALREFLRGTPTLRELRLDRLPIDPGGIADALEGNRTLERVSLKVAASDDEGLSKIVRALADHPTLEELTIHADDQFGPLSSEALRVLLRSSGTLKALALQDDSPFRESKLPRKLDLDDILDGLQGSQSLKVLSVKNAFRREEMVLSRFFHVLRNSDLERLDLLRTKITQRDLEEVLSMPRLKKPLHLRLDRRVLRDHTSAFRRMLGTHPEIRQPWPRNVMAGTSEGFKLKHVWELNWHGRSLLEVDSTKKGTTPLSIWPTVLEKANEKPDVLFAILQGPAFAGSQNCR